MSVQQVDLQAVEDSIDALDGLGFHVEGIDGVEYDSDGLTFDLTVRATTRHGSAVLVEEDDEPDGPDEEFLERVDAAKEPDEDVAVEEPEEPDEPEPDPSVGEPAGREVIGVYTASDYGITLSGVDERFDCERVNVVHAPYGADLLPGDEYGAPDYKVGDGSVQLGGPGLDVIGAEPGDEVRVVDDGDVVRLELVDQDDTDQLATIVDSDGAPDSWPRCQACDRPVNPEWVRVNVPDGDEPEHCPHSECPKTKGRNGGVRRKRSGSQAVKRDA